MPQSFSNLSVVVITLNEQENLPRLVASLPSGVELLVLDSGSIDQTVEIAQNAGAKVQVREFDNYANQKNAALEMASRPWILSLDADEVPSRELWKEISRIVSVNDLRTSWRIPRKQIFLGRTLRFGKTVDAPLRLIARGKGRFEREIHEELVPVSGTSTRCTMNFMSHYSYKDLNDYFIRFNRYTTAIASRHHKMGVKAPARVIQCARFFGEFFYRYVLRGGFLDGYPGFVYALFGSIYVFVKYAKLDQLEN